MGPNLYSQTPGAFHAGGGFADPYAYSTLGVGTLYGPSSFGNTMGQFAAGLPSMALTAGGLAHMAHSMGVGGKALGAFGNTFGLGALGLGASIPAHMILSGIANQFKAGAGQQVYAQDVMKQVFGERDMGGRMGMGVSRQGASGFAGAYREMVNSADILTNDNELKALVTKFNDMQLLQTSKDVSDLATRFKKLTKTVRDLSIDLGTTLEGALPSYQRHIEMGFTDPDRIRQSVRTNRAYRGVGISMSDETIEGFQMSQSMSNFSAGGSRQAGAAGAQRKLGEVSVALAQGVITDEDLIRATGKRGERGAADFAQQLMEANRKLMGSSYGKTLAAALGETDEEGNFTGNVDADARKRMRNMSYQEITQLASKKLSTKQGAISFQTRLQEGMGVNMSAVLGTTELTGLLDTVLGAEGRSEDQVRLIIQQLTQMRGETIATLRKYAKDAGDVENTLKERTVSLSIRNRLRGELEQKFSLSSRLDRAYRTYIKEPIFSPIQAAGGGMITGVGNYFDNYGRQVMRHGIVGGLSRGLFGIGSGPDAAAESSDSRMADLLNNPENVNSFDYGISGTEMLGRGALGVGKLATGGLLALGSYATYAMAGALSGGTGFALGAGLLGTGAAGIGLAGSGVADLAEMGSLKNTGQATLTQDQIAGRLRNSRRGIVAAHEASISVLGEQGKIGEGATLTGQQAEVMRGLVRRAGGEDASFDSIVKALDSGVTSSRTLLALGGYRNVEQSGGVYGMLQGALKGAGAADTKRIKAVMRNLESDALDGAFSDTREQLEEARLAAREDLASLIEAGDGYGDGLQEGFTGLENYDQVENTYMAELVNKGDYNKLLVINALLGDEQKLRKLFDLVTADAPAKKLAAVLTSVTGTKFTESEAEGIRPVLKEVSGKKLAEFAKDYKGSELSKGIEQSATTLRNVSRASRFTSLQEQAAKADVKRLTGVAGAINKMATGDFGTAATTLGGLTDEQRKLFEGTEVSDLLSEYDRMTSMGTDQLKSTLIGYGMDAGQVNKMSDEELKAAGLRASYAKLNMVGTETTESAGMRTVGASSEVARIVREVQQQITADLAITHDSTLSFASGMRDTMTEIKGLVPK